MPLACKFGEETATRCKILRHRKMLTDHGLTLLKSKDFFVDFGSERPVNMSDLKIERR